MDYINTLPPFLKKYIFELALTGASCGKLMSVCKSWKKFIEERMMVPDWRLLDLLESRCTNLSSRNKKFNRQDIIKINKSLLRGQSGYFITMNKICRSDFQELQNKEDKNNANLFCYLIKGCSWATLSTEAYNNNKSIVIEKEHKIDEFREYITNYCNLFFESVHRQQELINPNLDIVAKVQIEREVTKLKIELENTMLIVLDEIKKWLKNPMKTQGYKQLIYFGSAIPKALWSLKHLVKLDLSGNRLSTISKDITNLTFLKELNLSSNVLKDLPELPPSLKKLNISFNRFKKISEVIEKLEQLVEFIFEENYLSSIPKKIQEKFPVKTNIIFESIRFKELSYEATSELAKIYQESLCTRSKKKMYRLYERLINSYPDLVYSHYPPNIIAAHRTVLGLAYDLVATLHNISFIIRNMIEEKYLYQFSYQKNKIDYNIWKFHGSPQTDNPEWGKDHALSQNCSILADAIVLSDIEYRSPLARLSLALADNLPMDYIKLIFEKLSQNDKNAIEQLIWKIACFNRIPIEPWDHEYGKYHLFDDYKILKKAVLIHIGSLFKFMEEKRRYELQQIMLELDKDLDFNQDFSWNWVREYSLIAEAMKMLDDRETK